MFWVIEKVLAAIPLLLITGALVGGYVLLCRIVEDWPEISDDDEWEEFSDE